MWLSLTNEGQSARQKFTSSNFQSPSILFPSISNSHFFYFNAKWLKVFNRNIMSMMPGLFKLRKHKDHLVEVEETPLEEEDNQEEEVSTCLSSITTHLEVSERYREKLSVTNKSMPSLWKK